MCDANTPDSPVTDDEILFRAILNDPRYLPLDSDGNQRISAMAFNDVGRRPSVDRAALCAGGPVETRNRFGHGSGVLSLVAGEIRGFTAIHGKTGQVYYVDVEPVPLSDNPAHTEIFGRPPFDTDRIFDRIKQALTRIATITIRSGE